MHLDDPISHAFVVAALDSTKQLDGDPLLLVLPQGGHDLGDAILIQGFGLDIVDILFVLFPSLLLADFLRDRCIPAVAIFDTKSLDCCIWQFGGTFSLGFAPNETGAIELTTIAWLWIGAVPVDVVIENKFFPGFDFALGKDSHSKLFTDHPLIHVTIWIT